VVTRSDGSDPARAAWERQAEQELGAAPEPRTSAFGTPYDPVYFASGAELPGQPPFTRGPYATMYRGRPWTLRQYAGFSTAEDSNAFFRACLAGGQRGLSVAFDLATHRGYDSDHARVAGDVGMAGVAIDSADDMVRLFEGVPLADVSVSMTMNGAVLPVLAAFVVAAEEQGVEPKALRGTIQNDILKEFIVRNTYIYPPEPSLRITLDVMEYASRQLPRFNPISVSGYHFEEAGAPPELELAYTLADGLEYLSRARERGLDVERLLERVSFFFGVGMQFFLEAAKLRAARRLWSKLVSERFAPTRPEALRLRTHCQTSGVSLTASDPLNNIVRTTVEALSAVLGGTQSLHTNAFDEAWALPSEDAARVARATQLVLQYETDLTNTVDPLAGSYLVESLTSRIAAAAEPLIAELEAAGGMTRAIVKGIPQSRIAEAAARHQSELDRGQRVVVGVNRFSDGARSGAEPRVVDNAHVLLVQRARLKELRARRDESSVAALLDALEAAAREPRGSLMDATVACMRARATVGEVSERLAGVFGRHVPRAVTVGGVFASGYTDDVSFQRLLDRVRAFEHERGRRPRILVAKLGQDGHDRGQKVIASGFADLGFDVDLGPLFQTPAEVARIALDHDVHVVGISTQAGAHRTLVPELVSELHALGAANVVVVCGGIVPEQDHEALLASGVGAIFLPGTPVLSAAEQVLDLLEGGAA
jgi:methylmalonyl-CoA mutase